MHSARRRARGSTLTVRDVVQEGAVPADELHALLERRIEAFNAHDVATLASAHAEEGVVSSPMFGKKAGRAAIEASYRALFSVFPDCHLDVEPPIVDRDRVAQFFVLRATQQGEFMGLPGTGRRFEVQGVFLLRFEQGQIVDERRIYDFTGLLTQIGVLRAKPGF